MRVPIPLIGPSYANRSIPLSAQVTKNIYPEINPESRNIISLHAFPGLKSFASLSGSNRGMHVHKNELYTVNGTSLYNVRSDGTSSSLGSIGESGRVDMASGANRIMITTGGVSPYTFFGGAVSQITDTDVVSPTTVGYINSQFIYDQNNGTDGEFIVSDVGDGTSIDPLNFAVAESHPDDIQRIIIYNQQVYFFGRNTLEPWYNSGAGSPPFDRITGAVRPFGLASPWSVAQTNDHIYFVDERRIPHRIFGLEIAPIGNPSIGQEWASYDNTDDASAMAFTIDQQDFFIVNFPSADKTWYYHAPSGSWGQLSYGVNGGRSRIDDYAFVYGKHIVADYSNGNLYELDFDTFTDNSDVIQRKRATAVIHSGLYGTKGLEIFFERVEFVIEAGVGLTTGQGSDPEVMIRFSDNGGRTWSAEVKYTLGAGGDYGRKIELFNQGAAFERIYELTFSDPTRFSLIDAHADVSFGT